MISLFSLVSFENFVTDSLLQEWCNSQSWQYFDIILAQKTMEIKRERGYDSAENTRKAEESGIMKINKRRIAFMLLGNVLCGVSVAMFRMAGFGIEPFNLGVMGLWTLSGLFDYGTFYMILLLTLLAVDFFFSGQKETGDRYSGKHVSGGICYRICLLDLRTDFSVTWDHCKNCISDSGASGTVLQLCTVLCGRSWRLPVRCYSADHSRTERLRY